VSKPVPNPRPGFDELSVEEQIDYVQSLWDRIATTLKTARRMIGGGIGEIASTDHQRRVG
jgi:hypothetical protein